MWAANVEELSTQRRVITWDMRGHGQTVTPLDETLFTPEHCIADMAAILVECGAGRAILGGLSLGGYFSLAFNAVHPDRVSAVCLFDTGPGFRSLNGRARWNRFAAAQAAAFERNGLSALSKSPEAQLGRNDPAALALAARGMLVQRDSTVIDSLPSISVPTLIVVGEQDRAFLAAAERMASVVPGAVMHVLSNAGHASNIDQPGTFNRTVLQFLEPLP